MATFVIWPMAFELYLELKTFRLKVSEGYDLPHVNILFVVTTFCAKVIIIANPMQIVLSIL